MKEKVFKVVCLTIILFLITSVIIDVIKNGSNL